VAHTDKDGIWIIDIEAKTVYANHRMAAILGTSPSEMLGRGSFEYVFPEDRNAAQSLFNFKKGGDVDTFQFRLRRQDGSAVWVNVQGTPKYDARGKFDGIVGTFRVIDEPKG
jgi:PAS domain S-box-containing protein